MATKVPNIMKGQAALYGGGILIAIILVVIIAKRFGLIKTQTQRKTAKLKQEKKLEKEEAILKLDSMEFFDPDFVTKKIGISKVFFDTDVAKGYAKDLYKAMRGLGTDESKIYATLRLMKYGSQLSQVSAYYAKEYKQDLLNDFKDELNKTELNEVYIIVKELKY